MHVYTNYDGVSRAVVCNCMGSSVLALVNVGLNVLIKDLLNCTTTILESPSLSITLIGFPTTQSNRFNLVTVNKRVKLPLVQE